MNNRNQIAPRSKRISIEFWGAFGVFLLLWIYLIIRANTVFYLHDEIVTKWSYVVHWYPFPNQGSIDANNHFFLSLLAGFFARLFNSESMFVLRLGSLVVFPLYFWSIYRMKFLFREKWNFYAFLLALTTTAFLVEFFALARGYGLALAFLVLALQQMSVFFHSFKRRALLGALAAWMLAVYASLTLIPFALVGVVMLGVFTLKKKYYLSFVAVIFSLAPLIYFVLYSFELKALGKLYYGGTEGFFASTIHTLTPYLWKGSSLTMDASLVVITILIAYVLALKFLKSKNIFDPKSIFALFFFMAIGNILAQHWMLDVNYPEDRTAFYLVIFFLGAVFFALDHFEIRKGVGIGLSVFSLLLFTTNFNFSHSLLYKGEHLNAKLITLIPKHSDGGAPITTGGRWNMENEMNRGLGLPFRVFQESENISDTLVDYMIIEPKRRPELVNYYNVIQWDDISGLALLKRKKILTKSKMGDFKRVVQSEAEFQTLHVGVLEGPVVIRCSGTLKKMTNEMEFFIVVSSEDSLSKNRHTYEAIPMARNTRIDENGMVKFDFSYALNKMSEANQFAVYTWNQFRDIVEGEIKLEVYSID